MLKILTLSTSVMLFTATLFVHAADSNVSAPVQSVITPYLQIHDALAKDSMEGISAAAANLNKAAQSDKLFPTELSEEAQTLVKATDLDAARAAFKPLSETLIKVLGGNGIKSDRYVEVYCPMEKAYWLQMGTTVSNPFGTYMATCGSIVK